MSAIAYRALREDFLSHPLDPIEDVTLMGCRCADCGEVFLGSFVACQNCQSDRLSSLPLGRDGTLFSYTVARNRPPGDYKGPSNPFVPYGVGLVELPEGVRIMTRLGCPIETLAIDMKLKLAIFELYRDEDGTGVLAYRFDAQDEAVNA